MMKVEELAKEIGGRFDHVLVDEYQDTNRLQAKILLRLKPDGQGMMVVGDDAQAIYSFRAATIAARGQSCGRDRRSLPCPSKGGHEG
jgi:DNA helicase-2/ATP-dependent DNA helicase PcrA